MAEKQYVIDSITVDESWRLFKILAEFVDGSVIAQLGVPDMKLPIQYALTHPRRLSCLAARLDLAEVRKLEFEEPDMAALPALRLGYEVARTGGTSGAVLSAANECAVDAFLREQIRFTDIVRVSQMVIERHELVPEPAMKQVMDAGRWASIYRESKEGALVVTFLLWVGFLTSFYVLVSWVKTNFKS